ncbi:MAG: N-acetyl sugar amidotransferase [Bernardetiaceae bacterium]
MTQRAYQRCTRCIMDTTDPKIVFDEKGVCNHCHRYDNLLASRVFRGEEAEAKLQEIVKQIKGSRTKEGYDCLIGVSGGVDSTYVAYLTKKKLGLNPLAVHFDNGWNSELAVGNIERTIQRMGIDLLTHVIDWEEFKHLQLSFLKSSTPDGEVPTDHAINALLFREANKHGIRYIINGMNFATESMAVEDWAYGHSDWRYIRSVHQRFENTPLKDYPHYTFLDLFYWTFIKRIRVISILNYIDYNKDEVKRLIQDELGWIDYGGKHYESVYTRFYQGYVLPQKFNIDKRIGHLSDLIRSGQVSREEALQKLEHPDYNNELMESDKEFVQKKFGLTPEAFAQIMDEPPKNHMDYPNNKTRVMQIKDIVNRLRKAGLYTK